MKKRWNRIVANPEIALASAPNEETDGKAFRTEAMAFARSLQERYKYHQVRNELGNVKALASGQFATNYSGVDNAGLGDQFVILRQDALIARILELRNLTEFSLFAMVFRIVTFSSTHSSMRYLRATRKVRSTRVACSSKTRWAMLMTP